MLYIIYKTYAAFKYIIIYLKGPSDPPQLRDTLQRMIATTIYIHIVSCLRIRSKVNRSFFAEVGGIVRPKVRLLNNIIYCLKKQQLGFIYVPLVYLIITTFLGFCSSF